MRLDVLEWDGPDLVIGVSADLVQEETPGAPARAVLLRRDGERLLDDTGADWTSNVGSAAVDVLLRGRSGDEELTLPGTRTSVELLPAGDGLRLVARAQARLATTSGGTAGSLAEGLWDVWARFSLDGTSHETRVGSERGPDLPATSPQASLLGTTSRTLRAYWTKQGNLSLAVGRQAPGRALRASAAHVQRTAHEARLQLVLPVRGPDQVDAQVGVRLVQDGRPAVDLPARLRHAPGRRTTRLEAAVPLRGRRLGSGVWAVHLLLGSSVAPTAVDLELHGLGPAVLVRTRTGDAKPGRLLDVVSRARQAGSGAVGKARRVVANL